MRQPSERSERGLEPRGNALSTTYWSAVYTFHNADVAISEADKVRQDPNQIEREYEERLKEVADEGWGSLPWDRGAP